MLAGRLDDRVEGDRVDAQRGGAEEPADEEAVAVRLEVVEHPVAEHEDAEAAEVPQALARRRRSAAATRERSQTAIVVTVAADRVLDDDRPGAAARSRRPPRPRRRRRARRSSGRISTRRKSMSRSISDCCGAPSASTTNPSDSTWSSGFGVGVAVERRERAGEHEARGSRRRRRWRRVTQKAVSRSTSAELLALDQRRAEREVREDEDEAREHERERGEAVLLGRQQTRDRRSPRAPARAGARAGDPTTHPRPAEHARAEVRKVPSPVEKTSLRTLGPRARRTVLHGRLGSPGAAASTVAPCAASQERSGSTTRALRPCRAAVLRSMTDVIALPRPGRRRPRVR